MQLCVIVFDFVDGYLVAMNFYEAMIALVLALPMHFI